MQTTAPLLEGLAFFVEQVVRRHTTPTMPTLCACARIASAVSLSTRSLESPVRTVRLMSWLTHSSLTLVGILTAQPGVRAQHAQHLSVEFALDPYRPSSAGRTPCDLREDEFAASEARELIRGWRSFRRSTGRVCGFALALEPFILAAGIVQTRSFRSNSDQRASATSFNRRPVNSSMPIHCA